MEKLHPIQRNILELAGKYELKKMTLGQIARLVGESYPQTAKYHISQLQKKELLDENRKSKHPKVELPDIKSREQLINLPIIGAANCGEANLVAEENLEGFLKVSPKMINNKQGVFVLRAEGDSMNKADVYGKSIESGDYVLVDECNKYPQSNEYVVSIIDGMANIKKFMHDEENKQIVLLSESTENYPPIYIHEEDFPAYAVTGTVIQVLKPQKTEEISYEPVKE
jgi:SOS-response transcriptional repressor LexA